jgi:hypothetical protein
MSAVILHFPRVAQAHTAEREAEKIAVRLRNVREALSERAQVTNATSDQKWRAVQAAMLSISRGESLGAATQAGYDELPSVRKRTSFVPTWWPGGDAA